MQGTKLPQKELGAANMRANALKAPPYSVASEKIVLAAILRSPTILQDVQRILPNSAVFFRPEHARLYDLLMTLGQQSACDSEQLIAILAAQSSKAGASDEDQLRQLAATGQDLATALHHANVVAEKDRMRRLIDALTDMLHDAYHSDDGYNAIVSRAKKRLAEF